MRWVLACIGLLVVIVVFSLAALDQKNVVWVGEVPQCPHCRCEVSPHSNVCKTCRRAFDWETYETDCDACLSELDAEYLVRRFVDSETTFEALLRQADLPDEAVPDLMLYVRALESGSCEFCGGTGRWLAPGVLVGRATNGDSARIAILKEELEDECPMCFGSGRCVLCGGDHRVEHAREASARALEDLVDLWGRVDPLRDQKSRDVLFSAYEQFVSRYSGHTEMRRLPAFHSSAGWHLDLPQNRLARMVELLERLP